MEVFIDVAKERSLTWMTLDLHAQRQGIAWRIADEREDSIWYVCCTQMEYVSRSFDIWPTILNSYTLDFVFSFVQLYGT